MEDFLPYLPPLIKCPSSLSWPTKAENLLRDIQDRECVFASSNSFVGFICLLRDVLDLPPVSKFYTRGLIFFFREVMSEEESKNWFMEVLPKLAELLLRLPSLLEEHYKNANMDIHGEGVMVTTALRVLESQQPGFVCLSQELIAALLVCSLFCLFPVENRPAKQLPMINFDKLFASLIDKYYLTQEFSIWCIFIYFQRIVSKSPKGTVSFERRVLPGNGSSHSSYPEAKFWSNSANPLCEFKVVTSRLIEYQSNEAVEVYFASENLGRDALIMPSYDEELRFMLSPELIAGMLFLPAMTDNETIEIVGAERFSTYDGFASAFRFSDVYVDKTDIDTLGRRKASVVAVDKFCNPRKRKYSEDAESLLYIEINKAFCGFMYPCKYPCGNMGVVTANRESDHNNSAVKAIIMWLAASQAQRPFITYCTYGGEVSKHLGKVVSWISSLGWTVGHLWNKLIEYSSNTSMETTDISLLEWLQDE